MGILNVRYLVDRYRDRFTEEEIKALEEEDYEIRQCEHCGKLMCKGIIIDDGMYYDSEECVYKHFTEREYICACYGILYDSEMEKLSKREFDKLIAEEGDEDKGWAFYTEWPEVDESTIEKLQNLLSEDMAHPTCYLNSILLEGIVVTEPEMRKDKKCHFKLLTYRYSHPGVKVICINCVFSELPEKVRQGKTVRVLGALDIRDGALIIRGQYVE